jgi:hypothetical protein
VQVKVEGTDIVIENFARIRRYTGLAIRDGVMREAQELLDRARPLVPTLYRDLVNSGRIETRRTRAISADVVFGGADQPGNVFYGWIVHEDLQAFHDDGQAKFLELPFLEMSRDFPSKVAGWVFAATLRR